MAREEQLSTEIVNQGIIDDSGPYAGSLSFSVRVRRGLPDFSNSVNLKYVKLGYRYLISHYFYFVVAPILTLVLAAELRRLQQHIYFICLKSDLLNTAFFVIALCAFILYTYNHLTPPPTFLVDFACYLPPNHLKVTIFQLIMISFWQ